MTKSTCIATVHLVHLGGGGGSLKTFIKVVKLNERLLHINEHYNVYTLNAFITNNNKMRITFIVMAAPLWTLICQSKSDYIQAVAQEIIKI